MAKGTSTTEKRTPRASRPHIALAGCRNAGKSSLINRLTGQEAAIVSDVKGTTTDPVIKAIELIGYGPAVFIDTPGMDDDNGELGEMRVKRATESAEGADIVLLVYSAPRWRKERESLAPRRDAFAKKKILIIEVVNQCDLLAETEKTEIPPEIRRTSCANGSGMDALRESIGAALNSREPDTPLLGDLLPPGSAVVMVAPIDSEAPKGRMILPQVQALRDALDHSMTAHFCRETELEATLGNLKRVDLVVTDSQAFAYVAKTVPDEIPLTGFSMLFARSKAGKENFAAYLEGARAVDALCPGDPVAIAESCTHTVSHEDIGQVKIPNLLAKRVGGELDIRFFAGRDFPDPRKFKLVIQCGGCMSGAAQIRRRIALCREAGVPATNYGIILAELNGILQRAGRVFET